MKYSILKYSLILLCIFCLLIINQDVVMAQLVQLRLVSSANAWQRQDTVGKSTNHLFGYQTVQLSIAGQNLSFHTYSQGFRDFTGPLNDRGALRFYNLYLKYSNLFDVADLSVGRQMIFAGVGNGTIDGGLASVRLLDSKIKLIGYYGALPEPSHQLELIKDAKNNNMYGAQVIGAPVDFAKISLSYVSKKIKPESYWAMRKDSLFNPVLTEITPNVGSEEYVSGDVSVDYNIVSAYARGDVDLNLEKLSRIQLFTRVKVMEPLSLTGEYIHREPRLSYNSIFWVFAYNTISEYELGAEYSICKTWQVFGKFGAVSYGDENSNRVTLGSNTKYISASFSFNTGYGGELAALSANASYPLWNNKLTPTLMIGYAHYKLNSNAPTTDAISAAVGAIYRPLKALSLDLQVQWINNKIYNSDTRLYLRGSYYLSERLNIF